MTLCPNEDCARFRRAMRLEQEMRRKAEERAEHAESVAMGAAFLLGQAVGSCAWIAETGDYCERHHVYDHCGCARDSGEEAENLADLLMRGITHCDDGCGVPLGEPCRWRPTDAR